MNLYVRSAGGILLKRDLGQVLIAVVERHENVEPKWAPILRQLPKGSCEEHETLEETAVREVEEETGYASKTIGQVGTASWSYIRDNHSIHETVTYFFLEPTSEIPHAHDDEFDMVRWLPIQQAAADLSYPEERDLVRSILTSHRLPSGYAAEGSRTTYNDTATSGSS